MCQHRYRIDNKGFGVCLNCGKEKQYPGYTPEKFKPFERDYILNWQPVYYADAWLSGTLRQYQGKSTGNIERCK